MKSRNRHFIYIATVCVTALLASTQVFAQGAFDETAAIGVLSGNATPVQKQETCRALRIKGTPASVPALAAMLPNPELSHMARYALEAMPFPEAGQALRDAVAKTEGACKAGVIISLGVRRDPDAVPLLAPALKDADVNVARAAAGALGRIGTPSAAEALSAFMKEEHEAIRPALTEGLLAAADHLAKDGKSDQAVAIYEALLDPSQAMNVRMGAFRSVAYAKPDAAPDRLLKALAGEDPRFRDLAAQIVSEPKSPGATSLYTEALPRLSPEGQAALLRGLAGRKDPSARPAVAQALQSTDPEVKLAAVKALGVLGNAEDVPTLTGLLASDDAETAAAANDSLMSMQNKDADAAIAAVVPNATPKMRAQLLELMANRRSEQVVPLAVTNLKDGDASVRSAALNVLALLGQREQLSDVLAAASSAGDSSERSATEKALAGICSRGGDEALAGVLNAMNGASLESRVMLLSVLASTGNPKALEALVAAVDSPEPQVSGEAVNLLSTWPTFDAAPQLFKLAQSDDLSRKDPGLRGYVRLAALAPSVDVRIDMLTKAAGLAKGPEQVKAVLGAWGTLPDARSLAALQPYLDDPALQNDAAVAIIAVATELGKKPEIKPRAVEALNAVAAKITNPDLRQRAQEVQGSFK